MHIAIAFAVPIIGTVTVAFPPLGVLLWIVFFIWLGIAMWRAGKRKPKVKAVRGPKPPGRVLDAKTEGTVLDEMERALKSPGPEPRRRWLRWRD